jgi:hypothetical protein
MSFLPVKKLLFRGNKPDVRSFRSLIS